MEKLTPVSAVLYRHSVVICYQKPLNGILLIKKKMGQRMRLSGSSQLFCSAHRVINLP